jgi:hypothetical protein
LYKYFIQNLLTNLFIPLTLKTAFRVSSQNMRSRTLLRKTKTKQNKQLFDGQNPLEKQNTKTKPRLKCMAIIISQGHRSLYVRGFLFMFILCESMIR